MPGYYHPLDRAQRLVDLIQDKTRKSDMAQSMAMQRDVRTGYSKRVLTPILPLLKGMAADPVERKLIEQLTVWDGSYTRDKIEPTVFSQLLYETARAAMADELGAVQFKNLLGTRVLDSALPLLAADAASPWWDDSGTSDIVETRDVTLHKAWRAAMAHLRATFGTDPAHWAWGQTHTLTHNHPLGQQKPLDKLFSVGPFSVPGGREIPNALGSSIGPGPWAVTYGPSTRRVIDFADSTQALGINPMGQSGFVFDTHYRDQSLAYVAGDYVRQWLAEDDVAKNTRSTLTFTPTAAQH